MRMRLKGGVNPVKMRLAGGRETIYYYHRATGTRLKGEPGSAEFVASFEAADRAQALGRNAGTISWLIKQYQESRAWKSLAESTREIGKPNLRAIEDKTSGDPGRISHSQAR